MYITFGIMLFLLGVVAASSIIVAKRPDAKQMIEKLAPYQGYMGAIGALWGVWGVISSILNLGWLSVAPIRWALMLASSLLLVGLGLMCGVGVLKQFIKDPTAQAKMDETIAKLQPKQGVLGLAGIGIGLLAIVFNFI